VFERKAEADKTNIKAKMTGLEGNIHADAGASPAKQKKAKIKKIKESP
jgi:hypothetical protein